MKKLGLVSLAAAVALSSSAFAASVDTYIDVTAKGKYVKAMSKEANEYNTLEVVMGLVAKNDDGITLKAEWDAYDAKWADSTASTQLTLNHGYVIAPIGALTLKAGYVEGGPFGTDLLNNDASAFKLAFDYKVSDMMNVGFEDIKNSESDKDNEDGLFGAGNGEANSMRVYVKGKADAWKYGARATVKTDREKKVSTSDTTDTTIEAYALGTVADFGVAVNVGLYSGDTAGKNKDGGMAVYAHALKNFGSFTSGLAAVSLTDGASTGSEFDPTYIVDGVTGNLVSDKGEATTLVVLPVIMPINDMMTADFSLTAGNLVLAKGSTSESYTEVDAGLNIALGKATNLKVMLAVASGDAVKGAEDGVTYGAWKLSTSF
jgi:hypothetical protein